MNQQAIEQLGKALDLAFGRPGSALIALQNFELIKMLANGVADLQAAQMTAAREQAQPSANEDQAHG